MTIEYGEDGLPVDWVGPVDDVRRATADWLTPFDGSGIEWHESLPSPYTYQESDFAKLVAAVHDYESRCLDLRERLHRCRADYHAKVKALQAARAGRQHGDDET